MSFLGEEDAETMRPKRIYEGPMSKVERPRLFVGVGASTTLLGSWLRISVWNSIEESRRRSTYAVMRRTLVNRVQQLEAQEYAS